MSWLGRFAPPLALMGVIFALSDQPHLATGLGVFDLLLRKAAHMTEYALLWLLWMRALRWRTPALVAGGVVLYAVTDELHQIAVAGRHGSPVDVGIDAIGVALAWAGWRWWAKRTRGRSVSGPRPGHAPVPGGQATGAPP